MQTYKYALREQNELIVQFFKPFLKIGSTLQVLFVIFY